MKAHLKIQSLVVAGLVMLFASANVFGQDTPEEEMQDPTSGGSKRFNKFSVGIHAGHAVPYTDIRQYDYFPVTKYKNENRFGLGVNATYNLSNVFAVQGRFTYGQLVGTRRVRAGGSRLDYYRGINENTSQGIYFQTNIINYGVNLLINVSNVAFTPRDPGDERKFSLYFLLGHGLVHFNATSYNLASDNEVGSYQRGKSGQTTEAANPGGIGVRYKINKQIDLGLETVMYRVNSDKLDGWVAGNSPDYFGYTNLNINYKFGSGGSEAEHLEWVNPIEVMYNDIQENRQKINALVADKDNDGVADMFDKDSNTPENTIVDGSGVALDIDNDGVPNSTDEDNFTDPGATVDEKGRALDSDGDGVPDSRDLEANTAPGALVNFQGKTIGDLPKKGGNNQIGQGGGVYMPSVFFDTNSSVVKYANYDRMATIARAMKNNPDITLVLTGHADPTGPEQYNMTLSENRANSVRDHLVKNYGISADRFEVVAKGETDKISETINYVNRRVDVDLK